MNRHTQKGKKRRSSWGDFGFWILGFGLLAHPVIFNPLFTFAKKYMETTHGEQDKPSVAQLLAERDQRIAALEKAFVEAENRNKKWAGESAHGQDRFNRLQGELRELQGDYENLRVQKGGFGFKMLLATGFAGTLVGIVVCFLFFRPTDHRAKAFQRFQREQLFKVEYAISEGRFEDAAKMLASSAENPDNALIREELESLRKITEVAKRRCRNK